LTPVHKIVSFSLFSLKHGEARDSNGGRSSTHQGNTSRGGRRGRGRGRGVSDGRGNNNSEHLKNVECFNCGKKRPLFYRLLNPKKNDNEKSNMVYKSDFKNLFQSSLKEMLTEKDKQAKKKENAEGDDESLDMNVFEKLVEGKHTKIVNKSNDDLKNINDTNTFAYSKQNKMTDNSCDDNNYNNDYDELAYHFCKRIKLKHEPEEAQENDPVQYTAAIIVEIKNIDGTVVPMRALLDTGTTCTTAIIILR
jgi:ribosomal protein L15